MKVLFIQKYVFAYLGIISISGYLQKYQHESSVLIDNLIDRKDLIKKIKEENPDIICFSLMSTDHSWFTEIIKPIKSNFPDTPILVGGVHSILYPEDIASIPEVDYVCYGEGEATILQLLEYLKKEKTIDEVNGIAYKKDGEIHKNPLNNLISLDDFTDNRKIYFDHYKILREIPFKVFNSSRGCPYTCTFCSNKYLQRVFKGTGPYVRQKPVDHFISEIKYVKDNYDIKFVFIADDLFTWNKEWLKEFSQKYKTIIGIPFFCTARADRLDEEIVQYLADGGCTCVSCGVETGNAEIRKEILNKNITDEDFIRAGKLLRKAGILLQTSNMFCLPNETVEDAIKTIDLNIKMGTAFTLSAILMPFPKTDLANKCIEMGILKPDYSFKDMPVSFATNSVLSIKDKDTIERIQKVSSLAIQYPKLRNLLIFLAKHVKFRPLHFAFFVLGTILRFRIERNLNIFETFCHLWIYRKNI